MKIQYPHAAQAIQSWIARQKLRSGARLPSARLLGEQIGFQRMITGFACNDLISRGLLVRKGYKLFVGAGTASPATFQGIVYVLSYLDDFFKPAVRFLGERGVTSRTVKLSHLRHKNPLHALRKVFAEKPAGVILWTYSWDAGVQSLLESSKIPMVICTDAAPVDAKLHLVGTDLFQGTEKALRHLADLGHRHIARVSAGSFRVGDRKTPDHFQMACMKLELRHSVHAVWQAEVDREEVILATLLEQRKKHPEVTALFASGHVAALATTVFRVPQELSVVGLFGHKLKSRPPLTTVSIRDGDDSQILWACTNLVSQIQAIESGRPPIPWTHALFVPELIVRGSTRALKRMEQERAIRNGKDENPVDALVPGSFARPASPWESWRKTYPSLKKSDIHNWHQFDLSKLANHSMTRENGWLGAEPLLYLSPGLRSIHGVPFQVIDESRNGNRTVVTFRSPHTHSARGKELPTRLELPVGMRVKALYFLHGCGWAKPVSFAEYRIRFRNGKASAIPLVSIGPAHQLARKELGRLKPNLQDWWPLSKPLDFPHAMHATVFNPADPMEYERYLYTLEWINPRPGEEVSHVEVRVDPEAGPVLALIAVTALL